VRNLSNNFTVFMYVTRKPRSVLSAVSCNRGRSWNVLPADVGVRLYLLTLEGKVVAEGAQKCFRNLESSKILGDRRLT